MSAEHRVSSTGAQGHSGGAQAAQPSTPRATCAEPSDPQVGKAGSPPLTLHAHVRPPDEAPEPPIQLSPEAPHRLRRAEDTEELRIREEVWRSFAVAAAEAIDERARPAFMAALDEYRRELGILALRRLGVGGIR